MPLRAVRGPPFRLISIGGRQLGRDPNNKGQFVIVKTDCDFPTASSWEIWRGEKSFFFPIEPEHTHPLLIHDTLMPSLNRGYLDLSAACVSAPQLADLLVAELNPSLGHVDVVIHIPAFFHDSPWRMGLIS